ncbi:hypothetical protein V6N11_084361 [Hibiscus sabdariffa]|uniref:Uncharacterized protein n=1 Tax=Hibiscus sabdariffa TaxID=183260 RepID=A0ABR2QT25_9ROSI
MGGFPSDTEVAKGATHEQCKAITTRSGKSLNTPREDQGIPLNSEEVDHATAATPKTRLPKTDTLEDTRSPPPFPQMLKKQKHEHQFNKFLDILKHIHINMSLVEALQQCLAMPNSSRTWCLEKP